ncbi:MAG TPA: HAD-IIA family hydrolase [Candidatus Krumholzibacteria bacterium]|nr:HAD-IIA family hydrolase [Candidatus Krumholzibacteria bacterium]
MRSVEIFRRYDVVLCDIDGVLHLGPQAIAGVPSLLAALESNGPRLFFITNNGTALPEQIAVWLGQIGLEIAPSRLITAGEALVDEFAASGLVGRPILSIGNEPAAEYVRRAGGSVISDREARQRYAEAAAVVVGSSRQLNKDVLDAACNAVYRHGVPVICTNPDVFTPTGSGEITLVAGAVARIFERELGVSVRWLGKPHRPIFDLALRRLREHTSFAAPRVLVVDDNLESGIRGGIAMGFDTMLVLSGWHRNREEADAIMRSQDLQPTYILDSLVE